MQNPVAISVVWPYFLSFCIVSCCLHQIIYLIIKKKILCATEAENQQQSGNSSILFLFLRALHFFNYNLFYTDFFLFNPVFHMILSLHSCY